MQPDTRATCVTAQFLMSIGFSLFYGSLLSKTYRIDRLFTAAERLRAVSLPDSRILAYLGVYASLDLLLVLLWSTIDPPGQVLVAHSTGNYQDVSTCSSRHTEVFRDVLIILRAVCLVGGATLAVRIRNVDALYSEAKFLAGITYNVLIISSCVHHLHLVERPGDHRRQLGRRRRRRHLPLPAHLHRTEGVPPPEASRGGHGRQATGREARIDYDSHDERRRQRRRRRRWCDGDDDEWLRWRQSIPRDDEWE